MVHSKVEEQAIQRREGRDDEHQHQNTEAAISEPSHFYVLQHY